MTNCDVSKLQESCRVLRSVILTAPNSTISRQFLLKRRFLQSITERLDPNSGDLVEIISFHVLAGFPGESALLERFYLQLFKLYFFCLDRVQVAGGVEQSKLIVRVQLYNFFSFSRDLENVFYSFIPEQKFGSTTIPDVVYFVERQLNATFILFWINIGCTTIKGSLIVIYFGGQ